MPRRRGLPVVLAAALVVGCADTDDRDGAGPTDTLTVFAAASLTGALTELAEAFESTAPGVEVVTNFAASSELVTQIVEGAPVDVFASADVATMGRLVDAGLVDGTPRVFAVNTLEIVVERGNPMDITGLADLADPGVLFVQCAPEVPCGAYAAAALDAAGVEATPRSYEENVKAVLNKVVLGEADAGIVYRTDVIAAGDTATGVPIGDDVDIRVDYPIAVVRNAAQAGPAAEFLAFIESDAGQRILTDHGFGAP